MHELSIVMSIVDIAEEEANKNRAKAVESIALEIGCLSGVDIHALEFVWDMGVKNTRIENARCSIQKIEGRARCTNCNLEFTMNQLYDPCPSCGEHLITVVEGKEMKIKSITLIK